MSTHPTRISRSMQGFTLIELLIVVAIIGVIAAIAIPGLLRARMSGNEASAIGSLRVINSGEAAYLHSCGSGAYAVSLDDLFRAPDGGGTGFVSPDLRTNGIQKSGYTVAIEKGSGAVNSTLSACNSPSTTPANGYYAKAEPISLNSTGTRAFATDHRGGIFQASSSATAPGNPIPSSATPAN